MIRESEAAGTRPENYVFVLSLLMGTCILLLFFLLNIWQPLACDDYIYAFIFGQENRVQSLRDIFISQRAHWCSWSGRYVVHCFAQFFLMHDKLLFNIANTLVLGGTVWVMACLFAGRSVSARCEVASLLLAFLILFFPDPGVTMIWLDGSCNYLWAVLLACLFLLFFLSSDKTWHLISAVLAPLAGNAHEGLSIGLLVFVVLYMFLMMRRYGRLPRLWYVSAFMLTLGVAFNLLSPGMLVRLDSGESRTLVDHAAAVYLFMQHVGSNLYRNHVYSVYFPIAVLIVAGCMALLCCRKSQADEVNMKGLAFLGAAFVQGLAIFLSGAMYERVFFGVFIFTSFACCCYLVPVFLRMSGMWTAVTLLFIGTLACNALLQAIPVARANTERADYVVNRVKGGESVITEPCAWIFRKTPRYCYRVEGVCGFVSNCLRMRRAAEYYGKAPFAYLTQREEAIIRTFSEEALDETSKGAIAMSADGSISLTLPRDMAHFGVSHVDGMFHWKSPTYSIMIPDGEVHRLFFDCPKECIRVTVVYWTQNGKCYEMELTEKQLNELRIKGIIPHGEAVFLERGNAIPASFDLHVDG